MRWATHSTIVLLVLVLTAGTASAIDIGQIIQAINPDETTKDSRLDYWQDMAGKQVAWTGKLYQVRGGFKGIYKVFIQVGKSKVGRYNVILTVEGQPRVTKMKKGSNIRFTGKLQKYRWSSPKPVRQPNGSVQYMRLYVIYLADGHITSGKDK